MKYKLEDICNRIYSGGTPSTIHKEYWNGDLPWLSSGETSQRFVYTTEKFITKEGVQKSSTKYAKRNSTVMASAGQGHTRGQVSFLMNDMYINQSVLVFEPEVSIVNPLYLYYNLDGRYEELRQLSDGTSTRGSLSGRIVKGMEIDLPNLSVQGKIVSVLYDIDKKIENNNQINRNLSEQAQAVFKEWFVDNPESAKWKQGTFSDLVISTLGGDWGKEEKEGNYTEQVYCVRCADIPEVKEGNKGKMPTRFILPKNYAAKQLVAGDIVVEISGGSPTQSTGRVASISQSLLDRYDKGMVCTNFCRAIKPKDGYSMFIYYYWQYLYERGIFFLYENGTTGIKNLDIKGFLENEEIIIPPKDLVDKFDALCQTIFNEIFKNGISTEKLAETRDTFLPRLMSGKLDVSELEL